MVFKRLTPSLSLSLCYRATDLNDLTPGAGTGLLDNPRPPAKDVDPPAGHVQGGRARYRAPSKKTNFTRACAQMRCPALDFPSCFITVALRLLQDVLLAGLSGYKAARGGPGCRCVW